MRKHSVVSFGISLALLAVVVSLPAAAQNNEITIQYGKVFTQGRSFRVGQVQDVFKEEGSHAGAFTFGRHLAGGGLASLNLQIPILLYGNDVNEVLGFNTPASSATGAITPGLQVRFLEATPIQPFVFAGVGYAHVAYLTPNGNSTSLDFEHKGTWGVSVGGGLDIMFGKHFGLRGEVRGLSTGKVSEAINSVILDDPTTRWAGMGGLVFRF